MFTAIVLIFYVMLLHRGQHSLRTLTLLSLLCYRRHLLVEGFICAFTFFFHRAYFDVFQNGFIGATHLEEWIVVASFRESNSSDGICAKVFILFLFLLLWI